MLSEAEVVEGPLHAFSVPRKLSPVVPNTKTIDLSDSKAAWNGYMAKLKLREMYPNPGDILLRGENPQSKEKKWWE